MENNKPVKDPYRSALKKKAMAYMPKNYEDVASQKQILAMIIAVVPAAAGVAKTAETAIWPKVQAKTLPIVQGVGQCALEVNKAIAAAPMESLLLEKRSSETLLKAWVALEYYSYLMLPEYSGNIRNLRDRLFAILRQRDNAPVMAKPVAAPAAPAPVTAVPVQRTSGQVSVPKPKVPMPQPPQPPVPPPPPTPPQPPVPPQPQAEDFGKTVMVERPAAAPAQELGKTVMVEKAPAAEPAPEKTQFTPVQVPNMFQEDGMAEEIGSTVSVSREPAPAKKKSKAPVAIIAAAVLVIAVVVGILVMGAKSVDKVEAAIDAIGTVTLESREAIEEAEYLYAELADGKKKKVENRETLFAARDEYDSQINAVAEVEAAIDAIGSPVTLASGQAVEKARNLYNKLREDLKDNVSNYSDLETREAAYTNLYNKEQAEKLYTAAKAAFDSGDYNTAISKIGEILDHYPDSAKARDAKTLGADCVEVLAQKAMNENRLEDAKNLLDLAKEDYTQTDGIKTLAGQLETKLKNMRPANGRMFAVRMEQGYCKMVITAKGSDLCIKLTSTANPEKYTFYYIREGETFAMHVKDGEYTLKYGYGDCWYGQEDMFGADGHYYELDEVFDLSTYYSGGWVQYEYYEFTLDINGGWAQKSISRSGF